MICGKCGSEVKNGAQFCSKCGSVVNTTQLQQAEKQEKVEQVSSVIKQILQIGGKKIVNIFNLYVEKWKKLKDMENGQKYIWLGGHIAVLVLLIIVNTGKSSGTQGSGDTESAKDKMPSKTMEEAWADVIADRAISTEEKELLAEYLVDMESVDKLEELVLMDLDIYMENRYLLDEVSNLWRTTVAFDSYIKSEVYWKDINGLSELFAKTAECWKQVDDELYIRCEDEQGVLSPWYYSASVKWYPMGENKIQMRAYKGLIEVGKKEVGSIVADYRKEGEGIVLTIDNTEYKLMPGTKEIEAKREAEREAEAIEFIKNNWGKTEEEILWGE